MTFYIGASKYDDFHPLPLGLYLLTSGSGFKVQRIALPSGLLPRDLLIEEGMLWVLTSQQAGNSHFIKVFRAPLSAPAELEEIISFTYSGFARSFERFNSDFYFAIGSDLADPTDPDAEDNWRLPEVTG
ncbi:MAG: hypothetical protein HQL31_09330, partial [Planctomycetes bacterium]|nr:hypothetical protein [Planctomycetota bacterium]